MRAKIAHSTVAPLLKPIQIFSRGEKLVALERQYPDDKDAAGEITSDLLPTFDADTPDPTGCATRWKL